jgi:hypothetical protein
MTKILHAMTIQDVAVRLSALCRQGKYEEAQKELYNPDAESEEPPHSPGFQSVKGLEAIINKGEQFRNMIETIHGGSVSEPIIAGDHFAISILLDVTLKGMGRMNMDEIAVYTVKDGKVVKEQFFYSTMA